MEGERKRCSLPREHYRDLKWEIMKERSFIRKYKAKTGSWEMLMMGLVVRTGTLLAGGANGI